jgi:hypothetical protein
VAPRCSVRPGGAAESGDRFGSALAAGDFNNDRFTDLAAGASGEDIAVNLGNPDAGAVSVLYGSADGLTRAGGQLFTQPGSDIRADEQFGFALAAGDFDNDGFADLAAGAPGEAVGNDSGTGAVSVLAGSPAGLTATGAQFFTQVGGPWRTGRVRVGPGRRGLQQRRVRGPGRRRSR